MIRKIEEQLCDLAEQNHIKIDLINLVNKLGVTVLYHDKFFVGINSELEKGIQYNEILAHELAHCIMNNLYLIDDNNRLKYVNQGFYERQAADWCVKNLLSYEKLKNAIREHCDDGNLYFVADALSCSIEFLRYAINYYEIRGYEI